MIGQMVDRYRVVSQLGEGGMGAVYLAEDPQLGRRVAVKAMKKELAADPEAKHRFLREARAMATIEHDNIMTIYAVGEDRGTPYLVMPVLKGETLDDRLRRESRLSVAETCRIGQEIAAGLAELATLYRRATEGGRSARVILFYRYFTKQLGDVARIATAFGLPIVRTSPDHGTGFDIAGKGVARDDSFRAALKFAWQMAERRAAQ